MYVIFAGDQYYARGGWDDYQDIIFEDIEDAKRYAELITKELVDESKDYTPKDWSHIVDLNGLYIVARFGTPAHGSPVQGKIGR